MKDIDYRYDEQSSKWVVTIDGEDYYDFNTEELAQQEVYELMCTESVVAAGR